MIAWPWRSSAVSLVVLGSLTLTAYSADRRPSAAPPDQGIAGAPSQRTDWALGDSGEDVGDAANAGSETSAATQTESAPEPLL